MLSLTTKTACMLVMRDSHAPSLASSLGSNRTLIVIGVRKPQLLYYQNILGVTGLSSRTSQARQMLNLVTEVPCTVSWFLQEQEPNSRGYSNGVNPTLASKVL